MKKIITIKDNVNIKNININFKNKICDEQRSLVPERNYNRLIKHELTQNQYNRIYGVMG